MANAPRHPRHRILPFGALMLLGLALWGWLPETWEARTTPTASAEPAPGWSTGQSAGRSALETVLASGPREGDLVFRRSETLLGTAVRSFDGDSRFSHVGILVAAEPPSSIEGTGGAEGIGGIGDLEAPGAHAARWQVVHTEPGGEADPGHAVAEPLAAFLDPSRVSEAALARPRPAWTRAAPPRGAAHRDDAARDAATAARALAAARVPFDERFDLEDPSRLYCTELVWRAWLTAGVDLLAGAPGGSGEPGTPVEIPLLGLPLGERPVLLPGTLEASPALERVEPSAPFPSSKTRSNTRSKTVSTNLADPSPGDLP